MTVRVFVGCSDGQDTESQAVLEYSLRRYASQPVELVWLKPNPDPAHPLGGWDTHEWGTPFSGLRWAIPHLCGYEGRAIYLDSDMIVLGDIAELWAQEMPGKAVALVTGEGRKQRTCVMVLDCARARRFLPDLEDVKRQANGRRFNELLAASPKLYGQIEGRWNVVDLKGVVLGDPSVKLIHYSGIAFQPHLARAEARLAAEGRRHWYDGERYPHWRPELVALFDQLLQEATEAGFGPERYEPEGEPFYPQIRSYRGVRVKGYSA
jgi:hypothetical protein